MKLVAAIAAAVTGCGILALQIFGGIEATQGGTPYTQASMIGTMVVVAILPLFAMTAWRSGSKALAGSLWIAFAAFLVYAWPATIGRVGEVREAKAAAAVDVEAARAELGSIRRSLAYAEPDQIKECIGAPDPLPADPKRWPECRRKMASVKAFKNQIADLERQIAGQPVAGDLGSDTLAWATMGQLTAATIRKLGGLGYATGLEFSIWALFAMAHVFFGQWIRERSVTVRQTVSEPVREQVKALDWTEAGDLTDEQLAELARLIRAQKRPLNNNEVRDLCGWKSKGTASKAVSRLVAKGMADRRRVGREVAITVH